MERQYWIAAFAVIIGDQAIAQVADFEIRPDEVVPICSRVPELCNTDPAPIARQNDDDATVVPICALYPELCIPGQAEGGELGVGVVIDEGGELPEGSILIDPRNIFVGEGVIVVPLPDSGNPGPD